MVNELFNISAIPEYIEMEIFFKKNIQSLDVWVNSRDGLQCMLRQKEKERKIFF